jgi:hypothetical protein
VVSAKDAVMGLRPDFVGMFMAAFCWLDFSEEAAVGMRLPGACWWRAAAGYYASSSPRFAGFHFFACCFFASDA